MRISQLLLGGVTYRCATPKGGPHADNAAKESGEMRLVCESTCQRNLRQPLPRGVILSLARSTLRAARYAMGENARLCLLQPPNRRAGKRITAITSFSTASPLGSHRMLPCTLAGVNRPLSAISKVAADGDGRNLDVERRACHSDFRRLRRYCAHQGPECVVGAGSR
jgi:hypothetical protein